MFFARREAISFRGPTAESSPEAPWKKRASRKRSPRQAFGTSSNRRIELCPDLAEAEILETWSGLRPGTPDDLPILGFAGTENLILATGHYRNGILLAPITAKLVRDWLIHGRTSFDTQAFSPSRFRSAKRELAMP